MHSTSRINATNFFGTLSLTLSIILAMLALVAGPALADNPQSECDDSPFVKYEESTSGVWGSTTFDQDVSLSVTVNSGYEVQVCTFGGDGTGGSGNSTTGWLGEGVHTDFTRLSHYGITFRQLPDPETVEVCEVSTGDIIEVDEGDADNEGFAPVDDEACDEVQGITDEQDPEPTTDEEPEEEPAALPATEVKGEQVASGGELPNTGMEHVIMLLLASALFALGGSFLLLSDRRRTVIG